MTHYWEFDILILFFLVMLLYVLGEFAYAWWRYRKRWKAVKPHYGSVYDASSQRQPRPNVRLIRP
jgi:heme/copper-type cytochrome/quinol oxidase subunit 2